MSVGEGSNGPARRRQRRRLQQQQSQLPWQLTKIGADAAWDVTKGVARQGSGLIACGCEFPAPSERAHRCCMHVANRANSLGPHSFNPSSRLQHTPPNLANDTMWRAEHGGGGCAGYRR
jgi:hypothetical protein